MPLVRLFLAATSSRNGSSLLIERAGNPLASRATGPRPSRSGICTDTGAEGRGLPRWSARRQVAEMTQSVIGC
jgi:hypothetical protein